MNLFDEKVFLDRNPKVFQLVIDYLRNNMIDFDIKDEQMKTLFDIEIKNWKLEFSCSDVYTGIQDLFNSEPEKANEGCLKVWK